MNRYLIKPLVIGLVILCCFLCIGSTRAYSSVQNYNKSISSPHYIDNQTTTDLKNITYPVQKGTLSEAEKKLSSDLLERITSVTSGNKGMATKTEDGVAYVYVSVIPPASTHVIDPYALNVTDRDEQNHVAVAWVNISSLVSLASLAEVRQIQTVIPPHMQSATTGIVQNVSTDTPRAQGTELKNPSGSKQTPPVTQAPGPGLLVIGGLLSVLVVINRIVKKKLK